MRRNEIPKLVETLERAASRPLSLKQQCRNSIRKVLNLRSNGSSVWPYVERLEVESGLPEFLVDYLLIFPASRWRQERARRLSESLNNIAVRHLTDCQTGVDLYSVRVSSLAWIIRVRPLSSV